MKNYVKAEKRVKKYCKVVPEYLWKYLIEFTPFCYFVI